MLDNIKAVIFDMDGTLIDSIWVWAKVDEDYLKKHGYELPDDLRRNIEGLSFVDTAIYFKKRFNILDSIETIMQDWKDMVRDYYYNTINIKENVNNFLGILKQKKLLIGIATSNTMDLTIPVLERNGIAEFFDVIVTTDEVDHDKSFPDVYLETSRRLGIHPSECLVFEDTYCAILSAKSAGMKVVGIYDEYGTSSFEELTQICNYTYRDFESVIKAC